MSDIGDRFWQAYLVNFLFWSSLAQGGVIFAAALNITHARWGERYVRLSHYFAGFLPVCVGLFVILLLGRNYIFPWIASPIPAKAAYLNMPFLAGRGIVGLGILWALSWKFLSDTRNDGMGVNGASRWAVALVVAFMVIYSYLAFDLIMSLQPHWHSTLLGAHYAVGSLYLGMGGLCLLGCLGPGVAREDRRKLSQLLFGFSLFWVSLLWSQYIVIWYANMPAETQFVYLRFYYRPWSIVTLAVLALAFLLPFFLLMPRRAKLLGIVPLAASFCILTGLLLEKYVMVVPSLSPDELGFGWMFLLVTTIFAALFAASCRWAARRARPAEVSQKT